ncbi:helix-turn-helix domain-containing protein [Candidatus Entotheonella palauensis]|uniref:helix-turn-helix domain-containing protein n=1 Tax=Candidatus Entotheonella palauensis TaxID=93172 RepID=UPI0034DF7080
MRPKGSQQTLEWRRHRAIELLDDGKSPAEVADFLGVSRNTVYRWRRRYRRDGRDGIEAKPIPGRPPRLTDRQWNSCSIVWSKVRGRMDSPLSAGHRHVLQS